MAIDDRLDDPQPEAEAARLRSWSVRAIEALEDRATVAVGHARPRVVDPEVEIAAATFALAPTTISEPSGANLLAFASRLVSTCVSRWASAWMNRQVRGQLDAQRLPPLREQASDQLLRVLHDLRQIDRLAPDARVGPTSMRTPLEQVVDEPREPAACRAAGNRPVPRASRAACPRGRPAATRSTLCCARERRAELVRVCWPGSNRRARRTASSSVSSRMT